MEHGLNRKKIAGGFFWKIMENGGAQGVQFIVSVLLARMLSPKEYDVLAIMMIFTGLANIFVQNGFALALVQKKESDETDFSSVFFFNLMLSALVYMVIFFAALPIAAFYDNPDIVNMLRVMAVIVFFGGVISVQNAYISKNMEFRSLFFASFLSSVLSGIVSVYMAMRGYGVWALVWQQIIYYIFLCLILFLTISWKPMCLFSLSRLREMFGFGWKILLSAVLDNLFTNLHGLVMGKIYDRGTLGNFTRGEQFPKIIITNIGAAIQSVLFPLMAQSQDNRAKLRSILRESIMISSYLLFPMMAGMIAIADKLILLLLGSKWAGAIPFLRLMCLGYLFWPLHVTNLQALNALGRSDIFLKLEIIKKILGTIVLIVGIRYNALIFVGLKVLADYICVLINTWPHRKLLEYSVYRQLGDIFPSLLLAFLMGACVYGAGRLAGEGWISLLLQIIIGIVLYPALSWLFRNESFSMLRLKIHTLRKNTQEE
ncbi:MAG: lipopolysaccharide biosynthesis protein [Johnsonella sp.]|nr:lipopolysaccharide biosynthesis protein [Johnsonella sp.]